MVWDGDNAGSAKIWYRQCKLRRGLRVTVSWIPEKFAKLRKYVKLKKGQFMERHGCVVEGDTREWEDGWQVIEVGARASESEVLENERDFTRQRKASDI